MRRGTAAVELFLLSARRVRPDFEMRADDLRYVTRICRLVGGMPLGILLAASWLDALTTAEIAAEIAGNLDFLETELHDVPERQRSIRAVIDHSWRLLAERERDLFRAMAVFRGGFTREAAREVTGATLRDLRGLVNKSLLGHTAMGRYEVHELLRQYAEEKLGQTPGAAETASDRHCAYYCAALERWGADLQGARQQTALAELEADSENARLAWDWAVERRRVNSLDQAVGGLCGFYEWRGRLQEGETLCRTSAEKLSRTVLDWELVAHASSAVERLRVLARILAWQGAFRYSLGRFDTASEPLKQSLALLDRPELADADNRAEKAFALLRLGFVVEETSSDNEQGLTLYCQSRALYEDLGDQHGLANALAALGRSAERYGPHGEARQLLEEARLIRHALGDKRGLAASLNWLGNVARNLGQLEESERLLREGTAISQETRFRELIAALSTDLGYTLMLRGRHAEAQSTLEEAAAISEEAGLRFRPMTVFGLAWAELHLGQYEEARARAQRRLNLAHEHDGDQPGFYSRSLAAAALAMEDYAQTQQLMKQLVTTSRQFAGHYLQPHVLCDALILLGYAERGLGLLARARAHCWEALQIVSQNRFFWWQIHAQTSCALVLGNEGEAERAVELYALASCYPYVANSRWYEDVVGKHIAAVAATLPPEVVSSSQERGCARDLWETAEELLNELEDATDQQPPI